MTANKCTPKLNNKSTKDKKQVMLAEIIRLLESVDLNVMDQIKNYIKQQVASKSLSTSESMDSSGSTVHTTPTAYNICVTPPTQHQTSHKNTTTTSNRQIIGENSVVNQLPTQHTTITDVNVTNVEVNLLSLHNTPLTLM